MSIVTGPPHCGICDKLPQVKRQSNQHNNQGNGSDTNSDSENKDIVTNFYCPSCINYKLLRYNLLNLNLELILNVSEKEINSILESCLSSNSINFLKNYLSQEGDDDYEEKSRINEELFKTLNVPIPSDESIIKLTFVLLNVEISEIKRNISYLVKRVNKVKEFNTFLIKRNEKLQEKNQFFLNDLNELDKLIKFNYKNLKNEIIYKIDILKNEKLIRFEKLIKGYHLKLTKFFLKISYNCIKLDKKIQDGIINHDSIEEEEEEDRGGERGERGEINSLFFIPIISINQIEDYNINIINLSIHSIVKVVLKLSGYLNITLPFELIEFNDTLNNNNDLKKFRPIIYNKSLSTSSTKEAYPLYLTFKLLNYSEFEIEKLTLKDIFNHHHHNYNNTINSIDSDFNLKILKKFCSGLSRLLINLLIVINKIEPLKNLNYLNDLKFNNLLDLNLFLSNFFKLILSSNNSTKSNDNTILNISKANTNISKDDILDTTNNPTATTSSSSTTRPNTSGWNFLKFWGKSNIDDNNEDINEKTLYETDDENVENFKDSTNNNSNDNNNNNMFNIEYYNQLISYKKLYKKKSKKKNSNLSLFSSNSSLIYSTILNHIEDVTIVPNSLNMTTLNPSSDKILTADINRENSNKTNFKSVESVEMFLNGNLNNYKLFSVETLADCLYQYLLIRISSPR
ncbi:hypothetical protein B5S29_g1763 [[Candida] boidinii]|uniref:Unnamed protein product n=1 Tax=Candida boidinii TaxID=5477 RepID=A0ACB5TFU0_CANBO|nr:hypothetical protein B5S29_g1763 [[Candida] boidinii]GME87516.1 unnamed protein product [[Candida] boidinii]